MKFKYELQKDLSPMLVPKKKELVAPYLRGPIYISWLQRAHKLAGNAMAVGLVLWHYRSLNKSASFKVGIGDICNIFPLSPSTVRRSLQKLAKDQLIRIEHKPGQKSIFTMPN